MIIAGWELIVKDIDLGLWIRGLELHSSDDLCYLAMLLFRDVRSQASRPGRGVNIVQLGWHLGWLCSKLIYADSEVSKAPVCAFESGFLETRMTLYFCCMLPAEWSVDRFWKSVTSFISSALVFISVGKGTHSLLAIMSWISHHNVVLLRGLEPQTW